MHEFPKPSGRRVRSPWRWAAAGVLVAAVIGASTLHFVTASCAAELVPTALATPSGVSQAPPLTTATLGQAYFYNPGSGQGACAFGVLPANGLYVSLAAPQYAGGAACGSYLDVTGPDGTVRAEVVDSCPGCTDGGIDMSEAAFGRIASEAEGTTQVSYLLARDPQLPGPVELRVAPSSSAGWLALQVINNGNPLASVQVAPSGPPSGPLSGPPSGAVWQPLALSPDDYWATATGAGAGSGPFTVKITDIYGHQAVVNGIKLLPGAVQHTSVLMYPQAGSAPQHTSASPALPAGPPTATGTARDPSADAHRTYPRPSSTTAPHC